jgi:hypothetical protein
MMVSNTNKILSLRDSILISPSFLGQRGKASGAGWVSDFVSL